MNTDRSNGRIRAPPGGQSSIFFGEYEPDVPVHKSRGHSATNSSNIFGNDDGASQQQISNRRPSHQPVNSDIFGQQSDTNISSPSRRNYKQQQQQSLDVFGDNSNYQEPPHSARRVIASPEKLDIFGRSEAPTQNPGKRLIQQPHTHIFDGGDGDDHHSGRKHNYNPATNSSLDIRDNSEVPPVVHHRRPSGQAMSNTDVFGNTHDAYVEPTNYQTSSFQQPPRSEYVPSNMQYYEQQAAGSGRRGDTTQSLASCLSGQAGAVHSNYHSRPNTGNGSSGVADSMVEGGDFSSGQPSTSRKHSNAGQSSIVLN
mmetsp:Transcript_5200/g.8558  ORF Transcript_5200/g.8558 Transcript_5200/m.8558 type:complete len:312 (-) Transcript_5200:300-1235(-)